ncbi:unnamed protein product, partial [Mesorhabditis belari]|uniref:Uncharacterized protein n=1 Tax=Mesorhabditis belari TaxID=2138241 RepID=A0AAF3EUP1_9BILA
MEISPPVGWTFFPILPSGATAPTQNPWFFIGQSNDTTQAKQRATNEIEAAMLESLMESQVPLPGIVVNNDWTPIQVENPDGKTTGTGPLYGKVEGGALTQTAPGATTLIYTVYHHQLTVTVMNLKATRFTLNIVKNDFIQRLTTRYNVKFVGSVVIN